MVINLYLKEDLETEEESLSIAIIRKNKIRSQLVNTKKLDDLTDFEKQTILSAIAIVEKYGEENRGAVDLKYNL